MINKFPNGAFVEVWASASYQDEEVRHVKDHWANDL